MPGGRRFRRREIRRGDRADRKLWLRLSTAAVLHRTDGSFQTRDQDAARFRIKINRKLDRLGGSQRWRMISGISIARISAGMRGTAGRIDHGD
jgi:hypothetical protein